MGLVCDKRDERDESYDAFLFLLPLRECLELVSPPPWASYLQMSVVAIQQAKERTEREHFTALEVPSEALSTKERSYSRTW